MYAFLHPPPSHSYHPHHPLLLLIALSYSSSPLLTQATHFWCMPSYTHLHLTHITLTTLSFSSPSPSPHHPLLLLITTHRRRIPGVCLLTPTSISLISPSSPSPSPHRPLLLLITTTNTGDAFLVYAKTGSGRTAGDTISHHIISHHITYSLLVKDIVPAPYIITTTPIYTSIRSQHITSSLYISNHSSYLTIIIHI